MILDSDSVIWMLRGDFSALKFARSFPAGQRLLSVISQLELLQGCRNRREQHALGGTPDGMVFRNRSAG
jgi:hypothetical protein